jgi:tetratricopeptide (TPR) repeat protein
MSALSTTRPRHAWLDAFAQSPADEFDSLIRGYRLVPPYERADPNDVVVSLFRTLPEDDPLYGILDQTVSQWLLSCLREPPEVRLEEGINAYILDIQEAFAIVQRLKLSGTAALLRNRFTEFTNWTADLRLGPGRDLRLRYWHTLALSQTDRRFLSLWYRCCDEADRALPEGYLFIGLLGLQYLPRREDDNDLSRELLTGLARWARHLTESDADKQRFLVEWRALAAQYPRGPSTLKDIVTPVLSSFAHRPFARWWTKELGLAETPKAAPLKKIGKAETDALISRLSKLTDTDLHKEIEKFQGDNERWADWHLDFHALNLNFSHLGGKLLDRAPEVALRLAKSTVERNKGDASTWTLLSGAFRHLGFSDIAETVLWEATRKFPDNEVCRNQLAKLLSEQEHRLAEAEVLYRDTIRRFPDDKVSRNALAKLLADQGHTKEAEVLYRETMKNWLKDPYCRLDLGLLLIDLDRPDEVDPILLELRALRHTAARTLEKHFKDYRQGKPRSQRQEESSRKSVSHSGKPRTAINPPVLNGMADMANAMRAQFLLSPALDDSSLLLMTPARRRELREEAQGLLERLMQEHPNNPVVRLVAYRNGKALKPRLDADILQASPNDYALHLELARHGRSVIDFPQLVECFPNEAPLTYLVWLGDCAPGWEQAPSALLDWLKIALEEIADPALRYLHANLFELIGKPRLDCFSADELAEALDGDLVTLGAIIDIALLSIVAREVPAELLVC